MNSKSNLPNLIIPGAAKSGTSSLHEYLNLHPDIFMSERKEPHFFCNDDKINSKEEIDRYFAMFSNTNSIVKGESSTGYMVFENSFERIKEMLGDQTKFIFLLRNPIDRAHSHYWYIKGVGAENDDDFFSCFKENMEDRPKHKNSLVGGNFKYYYQFGLYGKWINKFLEVFTSDNMLIITTEELKSNKKATLNRCFRFLGLSEMEDIADITTNRTVVLNNASFFNKMKKVIFVSGNFLAKAFHRNSFLFRVLRKIKKWFVDVVFNILKSEKSYGNITAKERNMLKEYYVDDVLLLKSISGLNFPEWKDFN